MTTKPTVFTPNSAIATAVHPSPNIEPRRGGRPPNILLLHYTGMRSGPLAVDYLARPDAKVSCHYVVDTDGTVTQMVAESMRAWHAGVSSWHGETDINSLSIGIEIQNPGHEMGYHDFPEAQMRAVIALCQDIVTRNAIPPERVLAHSDVTPMRKIDPGEKFNWQRLHRAHVGAWVKPSPPHDDDLGLGPNLESETPAPPQACIAAAQRLLHRYGYDVPCSGIYCEVTLKTVAAFQRHFRPARVDGCLDLSTLATLERLLAAYPTPVAAAAPTAIA
ncbi:MAG: N-acetylmuramoyl-L-alanine amidase [Hyphomicrobiaceae bacterium]|nr:N-acetylmuramoyl-L-alanine amidase [Hyphomicrobiaceae bacterium]